MSLAEKRVVMNFYHFAPLRLGAGSIIEPGNWGRIVRRYFITPGPNVPAVALREAIFEQIRAVSFPDRPARMRSAFLCPTMNDVELYRPANAGLGVLHEVEVLDHTKPIFQTHFAHCVVPMDTPAMPYFEAAAMRYWAAVPAEQPGLEVLTESALRVVSCLES